MKQDSLQSYNKYLYIAGIKKEESLQVIISVTSILKERYLCIMSIHFIYKIDLY